MDGGSGREITDIDERKQEEFHVEDRYKINSCANILGNNHTLQFNSLIMNSIESRVSLSPR